MFFKYFAKLSQMRQCINGWSEKKEVKEHDMHFIKIKFSLCLITNMYFLFSCVSYLKLYKCWFLGSGSYLKYKMLVPLSYLCAKRNKTAMIKVINFGSSQRFRNIIACTTKNRLL